MKNTWKKNIVMGVILIALFIIYTILIQIIDVKPLGLNGTDIGFYTINSWFHNLCGLNFTLYTVTDWAGLIPLFVMIAFAFLGLFQFIKRKDIKKVDLDIIILGAYYIAIIIIYFIFEIVTINFRPVLINGFIESSYPSSTTLLVLGIMPTLTELIGRRCKFKKIKIATIIFTITFSLGCVICRLVSGVHWLTDIVGSVIIASGLFCIYKGLISYFYSNYN